MDPTTLVTFLFRTNPENNPRSVELLGSWDNFSTPYTMHHDRRRGAGSWSGCFKFDNIIFDGQAPLNKIPRSGGLKQGGTYWYYFRLDHDVEAYDDTQLTVTSCPLLPGQRMNVIEVPCEVVRPPTRCRSACDDIAGTLAELWPHTLEPSSKYALLEPPPISKVHARCVSELALHIDTTPEKKKQRDSVHSSQSYRQSPISDSSSSIYSQSDYDPACSERSASPIYEASRVQTPEELHDIPHDEYRFSVIEEEEMGYELDDDQHNMPLEPPHFPSYPHESLSRPISIQNIQFYGSRPSTAQSEIQWRPRIYSLPKRSNSDLRSHVVYDTPRRPHTSYHECDPDSPSYSIDTVSSDGISTPPRLSMDYSPRRSEESYTHEQEQLSIPPPPSRAPPPPPPPRTSRSTRSRRDPLNFFGYALPSAAVESAQSLISKISSHTPRLSISSTVHIEERPTLERPPVLQLSIPTFEQTTNESLMEDIFSELGL